MPLSYGEKKAIEWLKEQNPTRSMGTGEPPEEASSPRLWNFVSTGAFPPKLRTFPPQNLGQLNAQIRRRERRV